MYLLQAFSALCLYTLAVDACGQTNYAGSRVIGGETARPNSWPWQVAIYYRRRFICGGSLVSPTWVVTAAHCVKGVSHYFMDIVLGEHDRHKKEGPEQILRVKRAIAHPWYNPQTVDNDIAMINLDKPAQLNSKVQPVCLPEYREKVPPGTTCFITGWGKMQFPGNAATVLQQSPLRVVSQEECTRVNSRNMGVRITNNMLCAGYGPSSPRSGCMGDSGGPFVCKQGDRWVLHGDVSWGSARCSSKDGYTVFGRVSNYANWIDQYINH